MKIDAHQHFWKLSRGDYAWITSEMPILHQDYLPQDLAPHLEEHGIEGTVVIQAAPTVEETEYLLQLAASTPSVFGVVGWLDFESPTFEQDYRRLRKNSKFVGLRPMLQDLADDAWVLQEIVMEHMQLLATDSFPLDLLVIPRQLPTVITLLERLPDLRAVVDHIAKPNIAGQVFDPWRAEMRDIASHPSVSCKLSGMVTEAGKRWSMSEIEPYIDHVVALFGSNRLIYGSDWPVCRLAANYGQVYGLAESVLGRRMIEKQLEDVFGENAKSFYHLKPCDRQ